jgi:hypothetical protein
MPRPFRARLGEQTIVGGIKQILIVEQGVVPGEDRRDVGVKFILQQGGELRQRLVDGPAQSLLLAGDIGGGWTHRLDQGQRIAQRDAFDAPGGGRGRCRLRRRRFAEVLGGQRLKRRQRRSASGPRASRRSLSLRRTCNRAIWLRLSGLTHFPFSPAADRH